MPRRQDCPGERRPRIARDWVLSKTNDDGCRRTSLRTETQGRTQADLRRIAADDVEPELVKSSVNSRILGHGLATCNYLIAQWRLVMVQPNHCTIGGVVSEFDRIVKDIVLRAPVEPVWHAITDIAEFAQ